MIYTEISSFDSRCHNFLKIIRNANKDDIFCQKTPFPGIFAQTSEITVQFSNFYYTRLLLEVLRSEKFETTKFF